MALFESLDERLRRRRLEAQQNIQNAMLMNQRAASTPAEQAGTGIGNLLGALGAKYFIGDEQPTEKDLEMERARQGLFSGAQQNEVTPDGGMRSVPREMSLADDYNYRADKFFDYAQKYGDKDAFTLGMQFKKLALDETQNLRANAARPSAFEKLTQQLIIADPSMAVEEAKAKSAELLNIELPTTETMPEQAVAPSAGVAELPEGATIITPTASATPLAMAPIPLGTDIVDQDTVDQRVDEQLSKAGLTRETAPPQLVKRFEELEKRFRPYGN